MALNLLARDRTLCRVMCTLWWLLAVLMPSSIAARDAASAAATTDAKHTETVAALVLPGQVRMGRYVLGQPLTLNEADEPLFEIGSISKVFNRLTAGTSSSGRHTEPRRPIGRTAIRSLHHGLRQ
jgi:CubicO group peptidase (beta-lactamase class C family)